MAKRVPSRAQILSRQVKRRPSDLVDPPHPSSIKPSWGLKKARTASSGTTDWANLGDGPAGLIAELVLAKDVADYVRFRAVCRPWRRCSLDPRSQGCLDGRYHPRQWIMLDKAHAGPRLRRFLNISSGECIRMDLPALEEHTLLSLTPEGLLLLLHEATLAVRLLNPLTQQVTDLPPLTALLTTELQLARRFGWRLGGSISVCGAGVVADASAVAVSFCSPMELVVAKPGDERWTSVDNGFFRSTMTIAGRFYCATRSGVMVLDGSSDQQQPPSLLTAVDWSGSLCFYRMKDSLHLVDNGGDLMLVHRMLRRRRLDDERYARKYEAYKVDVDAGVLIPAKSFGGRAVFMGMYRTLSLSRKTFPHVAADTLYLGSDCLDRTVSYNLADGSSWERWDRDTDATTNQVEAMRAPNIVDCLSYCIGGTGNELA
uniref:KIB1-4 beta-propeller domain-containing protein n=1 Tax=Setaria italica TaxID=4555 RepID=K3XPV4_SETIT